MTIADVLAAGGTMTSNIMPLAHAVDNQTAWLWAELRELTRRVEQLERENARLKNEQTTKQTAEGESEGEPLVLRDHLRLRD